MSGEPATPIGNLLSSSLGTGSIARGSSLSAGSYIFHIFLCFEFFYDIPISYVENDIFMNIADSYSMLSWQLYIFHIFLGSSFNIIY